MGRDIRKVCRRITIAEWSSEGGLRWLVEDSAVAGGGKG